MATSKQLQYLANDAIALEVLEGLTATPKWLPSKLFYDEIGSALFEQITELPEYYLTRTERSIFESYAGEMLQQAGSALTLVELGAGTATKTSILIEKLLVRQRRALFYPIDVSPSALQEAVDQLGRQFPELRVNPIVADYTGGVPALGRISGRKLVLYIGSSIGNFEPEEAIRILRRIRRTLRAGDALLLGADFAKSPKIILPAYDDSQGITAQFNKNILARLNREFDADFEGRSLPPHPDVEPPAVAHRSLPGEHYRAKCLRPSTRPRPIVRPGERIHTENSYKYTDDMIESILHDSGFTLEHTWCDRKKWFGVHLARV